MENGKRVPELEKSAIERHKNVLYVSYQSNGYKDERTELRILRNCFKAEILKRSGNSNMEFVLVQDQLKSHKCDSALKYVS
jgi:hypothetical protein